MEEKDDGDVVDFLSNSGTHIIYSLGDFATHIEKIWILIPEMLRRFFAFIHSLLSTVFSYSEAKITTIVMKNIDETKTNQKIWERLIAYDTLKEEEGTKFDKLVESIAGKVTMKNKEDNKKCFIMIRDIKRSVKKRDENGFLEYLIAKKVDVEGIRNNIMVELQMILPAEPNIIIVKDVVDHSKKYEDSEKYNDRHHDYSSDGDSSEMEFMD